MNGEKLQAILAMIGREFGINDALGMAAFVEAFRLLTDEQKAKLDVEVGSKVFESAWLLSIQDLNHG